MLCTVGILIVSYLVGALPTGYFFGLLKGVDITQAGSGNIGASNVARVLGLRYFFLIFLIDAGKAFAVLYGIQSWCAPSLEVMWRASLCVLLGNARSPFLRFRGGKGVATTVGIIAALFPWWLTSVMIGWWLLVLALTKRPAAASLVALVVTVGVALVLAVPNARLLLILSVVVTLLHLQNIRSFFITK